MLVSLILFYLHATPSGVESLNYNFKLPVIATNVGHFPETIEDGVNGYLARENDIDHMSEQMQRIIKYPIDRNNIEQKTKEFDKLDDISKEIINILEEYVKPAVAADGGNIQFKSYDADTKKVSVILQGACSGCPSSTFTLKNGIENMLKEMLAGKVDCVEAING